MHMLVNVAVRLSTFATLCWEAVPVASLYERGEIALNVESLGMSYFAPPSRTIELRVVADSSEIKVDEGLLKVDTNSTWEVFAIPAAYADLYFAVRYAREMRRKCASTYYAYQAPNFYATILDVM
jgi:hypothetical protein